MEGNINRPGNLTDAHARIDELKGMHELAASERDQAEAAASERTLERDQARVERDSLRESVRVDAAREIFRKSIEKEEENRLTAPLTRSDVKRLAVKAVGEARIFVSAVESS